MVFLTQDDCENSLKTWYRRATLWINWQQQVVAGSTKVVLKEGEKEMKLKRVNKLVLNKTTISHLDLSFMGAARGGTGADSLKTTNPKDPTDSCPDATCHTCITEDKWCTPTRTMC